MMDMMDTLIEVACTHCRHDFVVIPARAKIHNATYRGESRKCCSCTCPYCGSNRAFLLPKYMKLPEEEGGAK